MAGVNWHGGHGWADEHRQRQRSRPAADPPAEAPDPSQLTFDDLAREQREHVGEDRAPRICPRCSRFHYADETCQCGFPSQNVK